jgi:hypothetical protein
MSFELVLMDGGEEVVELLFPLGERCWRGGLLLRERAARRIVDYGSLGELLAEGQWRGGERGGQGQR